MSLHPLAIRAGASVTWERHAIITMDGMSLSGVVAADEEAGAVECHVDNGRGGWRLTDDGRAFRVQTLRGRVMIGLRAEAPKWAWALYWMARLGRREGAG
ncbi:hypothetical protein [Niveispirillum sp.]|uniref:hypothetical protein n=1 Tax=Niveispirillum sp. TaxID=1917217 RepID=UPI001B64B27C|nr:hypothetical protein [Niveispirillum sp.]MBP7339429.1 hypothetical protein [Niveispirillum sp.]